MQTSDDRPRRLLIVLGDQLRRNAPLLADCDPALDLVWMCEAAEEATHVPSHKVRTVLFLAAMRHFRDALRRDGLRVRYLGLDEHPHASLAAALAADLAALSPGQVWLTRPGEWRVEQALLAACGVAGYAANVLPDAHFICSIEDFGGWASGRKELRLEFFYRWLRRREGVLMDGDEPAGGAWNFDKANRHPFGKQGPGLLPAPLRFAPDALTQQVMALVERRFPAAPGRLDGFDWPVTAAQADLALTDFIDHRLAAFGPFQDAMWRGETWLYHARLSAAMNLKLIAPAPIVTAAEQAWREGRAPIASVEGFVRQVLGWREYVRGVYWHADAGLSGAQRTRTRNACPRGTGPAPPTMPVCARRSARRARDRLRPPHPAADGHRAVRAAARGATPCGARVVSGGVSSMRWSGSSCPTPWA
jgi:deoxyribodipyrimidine photolyase-related protein